MIVGNLIAILLYYYANIDKVCADETWAKDYIAVEATVAQLDPQLLLGIANRESRFNCNAVGDGGTSFGWWQMHNPDKKKVRPLTVEQAHDPIMSTQWTIQTIKEDGSCRQWSTCKDTMKSLAVDG